MGASRLLSPIETRATLKDSSLGQLNRNTRPPLFHVAAFMPAIFLFYFAHGKGCRSILLIYPRRGRGRNIIFPAPAQFGHTTCKMDSSLTVRALVFLKRALLLKIFYTLIRDLFLKFSQKPAF